MKSEIASGLCCDAVAAAQLDRKKNTSWMTWRKFFLWRHSDCPSCLKTAVKMMKNKVHFFLGIDDDNCLRCTTDYSDLPALTGDPLTVMTMKTNNWLVLRRHERPGVSKNSKTLLCHCWWNGCVCPEIAALNPSKKDVVKNCSRLDEVAVGTSMTIDCNAFDEQWFHLHRTHLGFE